MSLSKTFLIACAIAATLSSAIELEQRQKTPADRGYFEGGKYKRKTAAEKLEKLWEQCLADDTVAPIPYNELPDLFERNIDISYVREADELPAGRPKINHAQGVVGLVEW